MELSIKTVPNPENYALVISGEVDISNADRLREGIDMALEQPCEKISLDLDDVPYVDSTGIGVLVGAAHRAAERGKGFAVVNVQAPVFRIIELLGVDKEISVSVAEA